MTAEVLFYTKMLEFELTRVDPTQTPAESLTLPASLDLTFEGWQPEAYALLERLRKNPHIEQYRKEKDGIYTYLKEPFKRYRDDLVINWVLPNRLDLETEKNVFSRLLKNDFGAGGCHHHLWMAFYRPERRRLTDLQVAHSLSPDGFNVGLFIGEQAKDLFKQARAHLVAQPGRFLDLVNPLLEQEGWRFSFYFGSGQGKERMVHEAPLDDVPEVIGKARGIWVRRWFRREDALAWEGQVVRHALEAVQAVWPIYCFFGAEG